MSTEIKLTPDDEASIRSDVETMAAFEFQRRLALMNAKFERLNHEATYVAKEIGLMMRLCKHSDKVRISPFAEFCPTCGEYVNVSTAFSPETEKRFAELHEAAVAVNRPIVIPVTGFS
jgi:rRNA maturation protein Nop10